MRMRRTSKRMMALFDGMQTLFRLTGGDIRREKVDISRIATEVVDQLQAQEPKRQVDFRVDEGLTASGDAGLVRILLTNLISNAWKFTRDQATARRSRSAPSASPARPGSSFATTASAST